MHDSTVSLLEGAALAFLATGQAPPRIGNAHYSIAPFDTFRASDRPLVICAANDGLFAALAASLGRADLVTNPLFVTNALRHDHRDALKVEIEAALAARTAGVVAGDPRGGRRAVRAGLDRRRSALLGAGQGA